MFKPTKPQHIVNKKYADENGGGGSGSSALYIKITSPEGSTPLTLNYTFDEIKSAIEDGKTLIWVSERKSGSSGNSENGSPIHWLLSKWDGKVMTIYLTVEVQGPVADGIEIGADVYSISDENFVMQTDNYRKTIPWN